MKKLYMILILAIAVILPATTTQAQEIMLNGDLELWDDPMNPTSWTKAENISQETGTVHGGTYSAGHTSADGTKDFQQDITGIVGGNNYTISYYYFDNDLQARTRIWAYWLNGTTTLDDNEEELRSNNYSTDNPDWQHWTVSLAAPANADGFRFEVRVYKQDGNFGGMVYYDDFSMMAAGISPEPTNYPTDFMAEAAGISINLSWTDATGDQLPSGYLVLASDQDNITAPVDGTPVADDTDLSDGSGALNTGYGVEACSFGDLATNTPYYFAIYPYTNGGADIDFKNDGTAPAAEATTADITVIHSENFDDGWGNWTRVSVLGEQVWEIDEIHGVDDTPCAKMSGYDGQSNANEDWLISPALNFDSYEGEVLNFYNADAYDGPALEALISNDYDGSDPTTATWTTLTYESSTGFFDWVSSGDIDISGIEGESVYIAFKYTSSNSESATWEIDNILITGSGGSSIIEDESFATEVRFYPNPARNTLMVNAENGQAVELSIYSLHGKLVMENVTVSGSQRIDLSGITKGLYILQFTDIHGNTLSEKLVVE
ncbi:MAG: choice-of-anchor J domain-containing protein [Bacteroidales bacterium]|jgi:hypothetical protein|nr:choice-of-anchor J domain-containing protein [Bacteroidales bacterium]